MAFNRENFGKPKHGGAGYKHFKLVNGSNPFRVGPAFKSLATSGQWSRYLRQHFGYRGTGDDQNPKGFIRTFVCPLDIDKRTEMVKVPCAECSMIADKKELLEARIHELKQEKRSEKEIDALVGPIKSWLKEHNIDKKYLILVKNLKGEWGVLSIPYTAKKKLDALIKKMRGEDGIDPLDPDEGCWLDFVRTGEGLDTDYDVTPLMENVITEGGKKAKVVKTYQLVDSDYETIENECPDLTTVGRIITQEQINSLVESNGDPEEVDRVFNAGQKKEASPKATTEERVQEVKTKVETKVETEVQKSSTSDADKIAALQAQLAALTGGNSKPQSGPTEPAPTEPAKNVDADEMSDEDFLKLHRKKKLS